MTEQKPKAKQLDEEYVKEAIIRGMHTSDQAIANVILADDKTYTVKAAQAAVENWKRGKFN